MRRLDRAVAERDPYAWLQHFGRALGCVHIQQSDAQGDHHWPFVEPYNQQGRIHADRVLDVLEASGADEVKLFLEVIPPFEQDDGQVLRDLTDSVELLAEGHRGPRTPNGA